MPGPPEDTHSPRHRSLIKGRSGDYKTGGRGESSFNPRKKGGRQSFSHAEGRAQNMLR